MTPYERVHNRLKGKPVDKVPNLSILMTFAAKYIDVSYDKFCKDYKYLVDANIKCNEVLGIDMLSTMSDPYREAFDFGAKIEFPFDELPKCREYPVKDISDIKNLKRFNLYGSVRILDRIRAIESYKKEAGNHYPVLGVEGAFAEAADLRGINEIMLDIYDEPEFLKELINVCREQAIACAKAQIQAGADFIGIGDAGCFPCKSGYLQ